MTENKNTSTAKTTTASRSKTTQTRTRTTAKKTAEKAPAKKTVEPPKVQYTAQTMIPCRSVRQNILFYKTPSGAKYQWEGYGDVREMPYEEVRSMLVSKSKFLFEPWLIIEDEELMETPQFDKALSKIKAAYDDFEDPEEFFSRPIAEIKQKLESAPNGLKEYIAYNAYRYMNEGILDRISVVNIIDDSLGTNLKMMM